MGEVWMAGGRQRVGCGEGSTSVMASNGDPQLRPAVSPPSSQAPTSAHYFSLKVSPAKLFTNSNLLSYCPPSCEIFRLPLPTSASLLLLQTSPTCPLPRKAFWDQSTATRLSGVALIASHTQPASSPSTTSPRDLGTGFLSTVCSLFQSYRRAGMAAAVP